MRQNALSHGSCSDLSSLQPRTLNIAPYRSLYAPPFVGSRPFLLSSFPRFLPPRFTYTDDPDASSKRHSQPVAWTEDRPRYVLTQRMGTRVMYPVARDDFPLAINGHGRNHPRSCSPGPFLLSVWSPLEEHRRTGSSFSRRFVSSVPASRVTSTANPDSAKRTNSQPSAWTEDRPPCVPTQSIGTRVVRAASTCRSVISSTLRLLVSPTPRILPPRFTCTADPDALSTK